MRTLSRYRRVPRPHEEATTDPLRVEQPPAEAAPAEHAPEAAEALAPRRKGPPEPVEVEAHQLGLAFDGVQVLADVSFTAGPGTLTAVVGPTGTGRTALIHTLAGAVRPSSGRVTLDGHDVRTEYESVRSRIGLVPNEDVVHHQLTVEQALGYAAELRLPPDTPADERRLVMRQVLDDLGLTSKRMIQVGDLSAEERKLVSVAAELLTGPSMLVFDEPAAGLGPAVEHEAMAMLRRLADAGRTVIVATASPTYLDICDQVLLLTSRGTTAFAGPPAEIEAAQGTSSWSEIFEQVSSDPDGAHEKFLARQQVAPAATKLESAPAEVSPTPVHLSLWRQIAIAARRQAWLIVGNQRYFIFLTILPIFFSALALIMPGHEGLGQSDPYGTSPDEALEILVLLNIAAVVMGTTLTIRDVFGERWIYRREHAVGLSTGAYLTAKIGVYSVVALVQSAILTIAAVAGKGAPIGGGALLGDPAVELYVSVAATTIVSAVIGLVLSSLAKHTQHILLMLVLVILLSFVFCGGVAPLAANFPLDQISWLFPARWGLAASASAVDLRAIDLLAPHDTLWTHSPGWWLFDMAMLIVFGAAGTAYLWLRLKLSSRQQYVGIG